MGQNTAWVRGQLGILSVKGSIDGSITSQLRESHGWHRELGVDLRYHVNSVSDAQQLIFKP